MRGIHIEFVQMQTPNLCLVPRGGDLVLLASFYLVRVRIRQCRVALRPRYVNIQHLNRKGDGSNQTNVITSFTKTTSFRLGDTVWSIGRGISAEETREAVGGKKLILHGSSLGLMLYTNQKE